MSDKCPKCGAVMEVQGPLVLGCSELYIHDVDGVDCLQNQLTQRDKELVDEKAENKRLRDLVTRWQGVWEGAKRAIESFKAASKL